MKNIFSISLIAVVVAMTFYSCKGIKTKEVELKTQSDSLNYAYGLVVGSSQKEYYLKGDSSESKVKSLLSGFDAGIKGEVTKENAQFVDLGTKIGSALKEQSKMGLLGDSSLKLDIELVKQGLYNGLKGSTVQMSGKEAQEYLQKVIPQLQEKKVAAQFGKNKVAGETFLKENATKDSVKTTKSGLQYKVIVMGKGAVPTDSSKVKVNYHGTLIDGTVFDSSIQRNQPVVFQVNQVIKGWTEALKLMPVGSKFKLYIPQDLAYGSADRGVIKPFSVLIFDVELISIEK